MTRPWNLRKASASFGAATLPYTLPNLTLSLTLTLTLRQPALLSYQMLRLTTCGVNHCWLVMLTKTAVKPRPSSSLTMLNA